MIIAITTSDLHATEATIEVVAMRLDQSHQILIPEDGIGLILEQVKATGLLDHDHHLLKQNLNNNPQHHQDTIEIQGLEPHLNGGPIAAKEREADQDRLNVAEHHHLDIVDPLPLAIDT